MDVYKSLIFLHIEKTAGTSLRQIFTAKFGKENVINISRIEQLSELLKHANNTRAAAILGHIFYGLHKFDVTYYPYTYYTMLRDPVDRYISTYYYIKQTPSHHLHDLIVKENLSIVEFAKTEHFCNFHVFRLAGMIIKNGNQFIVQSGDKKDALQVAHKVLIHRIKHYGIMEEFRESMNRLSKLINYNITDVPYLNVSKGRKKADEYDRHTIDQIKNANILDLKLYDSARNLFNKSF